MLGIVFFVVVAISSIVFAVFLRAMGLEYPEVEEEARRAELDGEEPELVPMVASGLLGIAMVMLLLFSAAVGWSWGLGLAWTLAALAVALLVGSIVSVVCRRQIEEWFFSGSEDDESK